MAHHRWRRRGGRAAVPAATADAASVTISDCVSITEVTIAAGWIAGLAIVALVATGWRKPARANTDSARGRASNDDAVLPLTEVDAPIVAPPSGLRRLRSAGAGLGLAVWIGAIIATFVGFGISWLVITLTDMLKR